VVFWVAVPRSVVVGYQHSEEPCCLHLQGWSNWRRKQYSPLKLWYPITTLYGETTQKTTNCLL